MRDARSIVRKLLVTEKGTALREKQNQYHFEVLPVANKIDIKRAIETIFSVKVAQVRTMVVQGKMKRTGRFFGRRPNWKKAVVTLQPDQKIELFDQI